MQNPISRVDQVEGTMSGDKVEEISHTSTEHDGF